MIGCDEPILTDLLVTLMEEVREPEPLPRVVSTVWVEEFLEACEGSEVELTFLLLNNMRFVPVPMEWAKRIRLLCELTGYLKHTKGSPVIALSGMPLDWNVLLDAGADYGYDLPVDIDVLTDAIRSCVRSRSSLNSQ